MESRRRGGDSAAPADCPMQAPGQNKWGKVMVLETRVLPAPTSHLRGASGSGEWLSESPTHRPTVKKRRRRERSVMAHWAEMKHGVSFVALPHRGRPLRRHRHATGGAASLCGAAGPSTAPTAAVPTPASRWTAWDSARQGRAGQSGGWGGIPRAGGGRAEPCCAQQRAVSNWPPRCANAPLTALSILQHLVDGLQSYAVLRCDGA